MIRKELIARNIMCGIKRREQECKGMYMKRAIERIKEENVQMSRSRRLAETYVVAIYSGVCFTNFTLGRVPVYDVNVHIIEPATGSKMVKNPASVE